MLSDKQRRFFDEPLKRTNLLYGSVRSGKTWISLLKWAIWVGEQPKTCEFLMVGKTITTLKRNCLGLLTELVGDNITYSISQKQARIFGRTVWLEGANDERSESKIRGMTLKGIYIDELTQIPRDFYLMALSRMSVPGAAMIATTNPDVPEHYVKTDIIDNEAIEKNVVKFLLDDNIFLDEEYKRNLIAEYQSMSTFYYRRFVLGDFVRAEGLVFPAYAEHPEKWEIEAEDVPHDLMFCEVGYDFGGNGSAYALTASGISRDGTVYVLKSKKIQASELNMEDVEKAEARFCEYVEKKYRCRIESVNCDHINTIVNSLNDHTRYSARLTYKPPLEDRPFLISRLLADEKIKFVKDEYDDLKRELTQLVFDEKASKAIPLDDGSMQIDSWDSFIYSISGNWSYLGV